MPHVLTSLGTLRLGWKSAVVRLPSMNRGRGCRCREAWGAASGGWSPSLRGKSERKSRRSQTDAPAERREALGEGAVARAWER